MTTWIGSDLHFGHSNILKYCPETRARFASVDDMNAQMIQEWNELVMSDDTVYLLGDIAFLPAAKAVDILNQLKGTKILIQGNHDRKLLRDPVFRRCFAEVHDYLEITHNGTVIVMFHYPIHHEWNRAHHGSVHCYGHVHGKKTGLEEYRARDVGFDATGQVVSKLDDIITDALRGKIPAHH
jgi:calcineurin-like phosphoesterase family protein